MNVGTGATPGSNNIVRFTGAGTTYTTAGSSTSIIGGASATLGAASGVGNALIISNQAVFNSVNNFYVGGTGGTANGPSNYIEVDNASYVNTNANRGIILRDGTLRIKNNGSVQPGMLNMTETGTDASIDFQSGLLNVQRWRVMQNSTHTIGDGTGASATYRTPGTTAFAGVTVGVGNTLEPTSAFNLVLNTDGRMEARGTIAGSVSALGPGATATMDTDAPENRELLSVLGNWDGTNIALTMKLGDFPTELAEDLAAMPPQAFVPPHDALAVTGLYTHGSSVTVDLQYYVAPQDQNYELQMISWGSVAGVAPTVNFVNGAPLAYEWRSNGLFLTAAVVPEPAALSMLGLGALGLLARRRRR
jgi:hypothetical protein